MTFEQPRELNKFLFTPIPWTPERGWALANVLLPVLVFILLIITEMRFIRGLPILPGILGITVGLPLFIAVFCAAFRLAGGPRRTLLLRDKYIEAMPGKGYRGRIRWRHIRGFQFEPAGLHGELTKVTLRYRGGSKFRRGWSMILRDELQREALLSELKGFQQSEFGEFNIEISDVTIPPPGRPKFHPALPWICSLGFLLLYNGLPAIMVSLAPAGFYHSEATANSQLNPKVTAWRDQFARPHNYRRFILVAGSALTAAGAGCVIFSSILLRRAAGNQLARGGPTPL